MTEIIGSTTSDNELIAAFKNGDIRGFNEIVRRYQKQVYMVSFRMVTNADDADDITQEVFIKIHSSLKEFRGDSSLFSWLYRIATNMSLNHIRKRKTMNTVSVDDVMELSTDEHHTAGESMDDDLKKKLVLEAIETLPPQQRIVFNMRYYDEMTYEEISATLEKSVGGLKANYFHAVKKISEYVKSKL